MPTSFPDGQVGVIVANDAGAYGYATSSDDEDDQGDGGDKWAITEAVSASRLGAVR